MITTFLHHHTYRWHSVKVDLCIPDADYVQRHYRGQRDSKPQIPFPYWTQVWPASLAMAEFLASHTSFIANKEVLELAGGLGLPSLVAAKWAHTVMCSDYLPEAVAVMKQSVAKNALPNVACKVLNWNQLPEDLTAEVLLLSDINYDPSQFETLFHVLKNFLQKGTTIILSTPQRLMAKPFLEQLLPLCQQQKEIEADYGQQRLPITILVLHQ